MLPVFLFWRYLFICLNVYIYINGIQPPIYIGKNCDPNFLDFGLIFELHSLLYMKQIYIILLFFTVYKVLMIWRNSLNETLYKNKIKSSESRCFLISRCPYLEFSWLVFSHIQSECEKIRTRKTPNTDTFHAM